MLVMALRNLWTRKTRSLLTVLGVGMAVMLYLYLSTIMNFYDRDLQRTISGFAGKVIVQAKEGEHLQFPPTGSLIPVADAEAVLARPDVDAERSSAVLLEPLVANPAPSMPPSVMAVGITPGREFAFRGNAETKGAEHLGRPDQVILGAKAAAHFLVSTGDKFNLKGRQFNVVGVLAKENELVDSAVLLPLETARDVFIRPGVVSAILLTAKNAEKVSNLVSDVEATNAKLAASDPAKMARTASEMLKQQRSFFATVRGTIMAVGVIVVTVVMVMAVAERKKEIGTMKAIGAGAGHILTLILAEAVTLSFTGGLGAVLLTLLLRRDFDALLAAQTVGMAVLVGALAAIGPAWSAQRVDPLESLRYE